MTDRPLFEREALERFVVAAKAATYAGDGQKVLSYRQGSHDLQHHAGEWAYHDCYFGGADFMGEEVVYFRGEPVWGMNYYGRLLREELLSAAEAGQTIKRSLTALYRERRFLGGFRFADGDREYTDTSEGDVAWFTGKEWIDVGGVRAYELVYHGGLIR